MLDQFFSAISQTPKHYYKLLKTTKNLNYKTEILLKTLLTIDITFFS
jgi:hypothetical protein